MKYVILDFTKTRTVRQMHQRIGRSIALPDYYGNNLDALYDVLTAWPEETCFYVIPGRGLKAGGFTAVLEDAAEANRHIRVFSRKERKA